ncbi:LysR family transcriptional regulator [Flexivirga caeni]|uniref:LysR family transcriptional regulator n=2 Tax=Flexivirga caeni TaxID=2294115 RepID=A0A3M9MHX9_9MICO|nr:LysR family transcriptional regulator [Flexivirga caeni]
MDMDPTIQQLRAFQMTAQELHFGRAAARMHMTQPPLTRHIRALEDAVGTPLFDRSSRRVELTPAGKSYLGEVEVIIARLDRAREEARRASLGEIGQLKIGYLEPLGRGHLTRALRKFLLLHPRLDVVTYQLDSWEQVQRLHDGTIDCGFLRSPANVVPDLEYLEAYSDPFVAVVPDNHRLAHNRAKPIELAELADEPFISYLGAIGQGMINVMLNACASVGFVPNVIRQVQNTMTLLAHVANGDGVGLVSGALEDYADVGVRFLPLRGEPACSTVVMAVRRGGWTPTHRDLLHLVSQAGATGQHKAPRQNPVCRPRTPRGA